jgi:hypothetical protein
MLGRLVAALAPNLAHHFVVTSPASSAQALEVDIDHAVALISRVEATLRSTEANQAVLQQIACAIDDISVLGAAIRQGHLKEVVLQLEHASIFDYIAELRFLSPSRDQHVLVVGRSATSVRGFANPSFLEQIEIEYAANTPFPQIKLRNLQARRSEEGIEARLIWDQDDQPISDLFVYKRAESRPLVQIRTRISDRPLALSLGPVRVTLPQFDNVALIVTSMHFPEKHPSAFSTQPPLVSYVRPFDRNP